MILTKRPRNAVSDLPECVGLIRVIFLGKAYLRHLPSETLPVSNNKSRHKSDELIRMGKKMFIRSILNRRGRIATKLNRSSRSRHVWMKCSNTDLYRFSVQFVAYALSLSLVINCAVLDTPEQALCSPDTVWEASSRHGWFDAQREADLAVELRVPFGFYAALSCNAV